MHLDWMRIYLVGGLVLHKAVWEIMKRRDGAPAPAKNRTMKSQILSLIKIAILAGIVGQALGLDILPLPGQPDLRAAGMIVYTAGLLTAVVARLQLGRNWSDIEKSYVKRDHALVARGLYRYVRHPIYAGDLLLLLGLELAVESWAVLGVIAVAIYARRQAIREEHTLMQTLPGYAEYLRRTSRFIPFLPV
jgi:protein-S-isoprenylcysteine O-methyltransferase Ste14